jgi:hypothetical protein
MHALFVMVSQRRNINCILSAANCLLSSTFFLLIILLLCSCPKRTQGLEADKCVDCYARDTLKRGEWITLKHEETLVSSGERFELGFFNATGSASPERYVGIWYKWDKQTVVWVANRDSPVLNGSPGVSFGIAEDGKLKVWDINTRKVYWTAGVENYRSTNRNLKLMNSGNLVLRDEQYATTLWESFQYPTDTFLPGMKMDEELTLTSWRGDGDPGSGNFTFKQDQEGEDRYVISKKTGDYWRSWMSGKFLSSDEMPNFPNAVAKLLSNDSNCVTRTGNTSCSSGFSNTRLVMKYNGELQYLNWDVDKQNWSLIWREPEDECSIYNGCGKFGSCNINNKLVCKCLPGFQPTFQANWDSREFLGKQMCTRNSTSSDKGDMFLSLTMMKVGSPDFDFKVKNETECKKDYCLDNSECQAYSYDTTGTDICWIWTSDLSNLQEEYTNGGHNLFVRVPKSVIGDPFTH